MLPFALPATVGFAVFYLWPAVCGFHFSLTDYSPLGPAQFVGTGGAAAVRHRVGSSHADGGTDGVVCQSEAQARIDWMRSNGVSWTAWKLSVGTDSTNLLAAGAPVNGGWNNYLHGHAPLVVAAMR